MKSFPLFTGSVLVIVCLAASILAQDKVPPPAPPGGYHQKIPWAVSTAMKGTVTNVAVANGHIQFQLKGWFWFYQNPEGGTSEQIVRLDCHSGVPVTLSEVNSFVAETADWNAASVQNNKERLVEILKTAEQRGNEIKFSLINPKIQFGAWTNGFAVLDGKIWQITDVDLH